MFDMEGEDRLAKGVEKDLTEMFLSKCKGNFSPVYFKDGSVRINGKLVISKIESEKIYLNCRDFHGKLVIENCPNLKTLEGPFFEKLYVFDGSITINQCPSLESINGISGMIKGDVSITNCRKLKDFGTLESVFGNLYWERNGKKYTQEQISEKVHVIKKIFCSEGDVEANVVESSINEAFNNQWLQRLADQFKKYPYKRYSWETDSPDLFNTIDKLFRSYGRSSAMQGRVLDKISNEDIDVYDMSDEKEKKELGKAFYDAYSSNNAKGADLILVYSESIGEFIGCFGLITGKRGRQGAGVEWVIFPHKDDGRYGKFDGEIKTAWYSKSRAKDTLLSFGIGYTVVVINAGIDSETDWRSRDEISRERKKSQEGVINPGDVEQYKKIAAANIKRYKDMVAQIRLNRKKDDETAGYDKVIDEYEKINTRVLALVRGITKDPKSFQKYDVTRFLEWLRDEKRFNSRYTYNGKNGPQYYGSDGLMYYFKVFMDYYMACFGSGHYKSTPDADDYKSLETATNNLKSAIQKADEKLKSFGF